MRVLQKKFVTFQIHANLLFSQLSAIIRTTKAIKTELYSIILHWSRKCAIPPHTHCNVRKGSRMSICRMITSSGSFSSTSWSSRYKLCWNISFVIMVSVSCKIFCYLLKVVIIPVVVIMSAHPNLCYPVCTLRLNVTNHLFPFYTLQSW